MSKWLSMLSLIALLACAQGQTRAMDYEVKLFMDSDVVLTAGHELAGNVQQAMQVQETVAMRVQFMDNNKLELNAEGWISRIRKKKEGKKFELTYKKRYPVQTTVDATLQQACADGFSLDGKYDVQVEWGLAKKIVTFSREQEVKLEAYGDMNMPSVKDSQKVAADNVPGKMDDWLSPQWGSTILRSAHCYGPVNATRYVGVWDGNKVYVEVWQIRAASGVGYEYVTEISFKTADNEYAASAQQRLIAFLKGRGWFLPEDKPKTQMVLERY